MKPRLKSSRAARELIKTHEPFLGDAMPRGRRWALGYGHTAAAKEGARITREDAELLLLYDVIQAEQAIDKAVGEDLPGPVRDALVSFACSIGAGAFKVSDVARLARDGRHLEAAAALETWVRAEEDGRLVVSERLVRRRAAEKAVYLQGLPLEGAGSAEQPAPAATAVTPPAESAADTAPRLGPLVDLELEFVDPPEPAGMVEDTLLEPEAAVDVPQAAPGPDPEPELEPEPEAEPELAAEPEVAPVRSEEADAASPDVVVTPAEERQDPTGSVIARMNSQMAETLAVAPAVPAEAGEERDQGDHAAPREDARLGFSFLASAQPPAAAEPAPALRIEEPVRAGFRVGPAPVYAAISTVTITREDLIVPTGVLATAPSITATARAEAPADSAGFSGEVQAVGRPADMPEEDEQADSDDIHPGVLMGSAAPAPVLPLAIPARPERSAERNSSSGSWLFVANLAVGLVMTGFGIWTIIERGADPEIVDYGLLGPVAAAMGIALTITSAWILITRKRQPQQAPVAEGDAGEGAPPSAQ